MVILRKAQKSIPAALSGLAVTTAESHVTALIWVILVVVGIGQTVFIVRCNASQKHKQQVSMDEELVLHLLVLIYLLHVNKGVFI